jgi:hypothetical protein
MPDLSDQIETAAGQPKQVSSDAGSVTGQSVSDLIEADRYLAEKASQAERSIGPRFFRIRPGGAV